MQCKGAWLSTATFTFADIYPQSCPGAAPDRRYPRCLPTGHVLFGSPTWPELGLPCCGH